MVSLKKKFILTHPTKCAGTSLRSILRENKLLDLDDGHIGFEPIANWLRDEHDEGWEDYRKISLSRNPWDRVVSYFHHNKSGAIREWYKSNHHCADRSERIIFFCAMTFAEFVKSTYIDSMHCRRWWCYENKNVIEEIIKFETLNEDTEKFMESVGVEDYILPKITHATNRPQIDNDYRSYYTDELASIVAKKFQYEIDFCGHTFDGGVVS